MIKSKRKLMGSKPVKSIELPDDPKEPIKIKYGAAHKELVFDADLVVGAFGLKNGYRPPQTIRERCMEIRLDSKDVEVKDVEEFLDIPEVKRRFPPDFKLSDCACQCSPKIAERSANMR